MSLIVIVRRFVGSFRIILVHFAVRTKDNRRKILFINA